MKIVNYGMGVDSTALLVGLAQRGDRPDLIIFADTGSEKPATYLYAPIMQSWLRSVGFPQITVVRNLSPRAGHRSLWHNCHANETLPSLAFGRKSCSLKWKADPIHKHLRSLPECQRVWEGGGRLLRLFGYDYSPRDQRRAQSGGAGYEADRHEYSYPLIDWQWDRAKCKREIAGAGLPVPEKSACFMCPAMKQGEIQQLASESPDLYSLAIDLEDRYRDGKHWRGDAATTVGLGRSRAWSEPGFVIAN